MTKCRTYIDSDPPSHITHLRQICMKHKHIGTASGTEFMGHPLLAILVILQLVLTIDLKIVFPHIHNQQAPGGAGRASAAAHRGLFERGHGYTKADRFAMTGTCVSLGCCVWEEFVLMHDSVGMGNRSQRSSRIFGGTESSGRPLRQPKTLCKSA